MNAKSLILCAVLAPPAVAQGFAGLGSSTEDFATPMPNPVFDFPTDHGPHPDYRIEWWYLTANLKDAAGTDYGLQWTLFRSALVPQEREGWDSPQIWFAHAAVTTPDAHHFTERWARGGIGQAGVTPSPFSAWIDEWSMDSWALDGEDPLSALHLSASAPDFAYDMSLEALGPLIFHGEDGYSVKSEEGQASYYYSQPFYDITGTLTLPDGPVEVTGQAWLDREWSSAPLASDQTGWDWFSLHFDDGARLMGFLLRDATGASYSNATWISPDGQVTPYGDGAFTAQPLRWATVEGREIPVDWSVSLPARDLNVETRALFDGAWMGTTVSYWEGPVAISGSHTGSGYLEMTGYE